MILTRFRLYHSVANSSLVTQALHLIENDVASLKRRYPDTETLLRGLSCLVYVIAKQPEIMVEDARDIMTPIFDEMLEYVSRRTDINVHDVLLWTAMVCGGMEDQQIRLLESASRVAPVGVDLERTVPLLIDCYIWQGQVDKALQLLQHRTGMNRAFRDLRMGFIYWERGSTARPATCGRSAEKACRGTHWEGVVILLQAENDAVTPAVWERYEAWMRRMRAEEEGGQDLSDTQVLLRAVDKYPMDHLHHSLGAVHRFMSIVTLLHADVMIKMIKIRKGVWTDDMLSTAMIQLDRIELPWSLRCLQLRAEVRNALAEMRKDDAMAMEAARLRQEYETRLGPPRVKQTEVNECAMCFEPVSRDPKKRARLSCKHDCFHKPCIQDWRSKCTSLGRPVTCPICRKQVK